MIPVVANLTMTSVFFGSTKAIAIIANPLRQFEAIKVFFLPQYFNRIMHTIVPVNGALNIMSLSD